MSEQPSSQKSGSVTVFMYESELDFLKWLVLQKPQIETGGDLFGLWQDEGTAVVQLILGPGKDCRRTTTSFHQDVNYLHEVGGYLTSSLGLCNIGEWHSHHTLGLAEPSFEDEQTVWNHISSVSGGRFLVFIANIRGKPAKVNIGCFLFNLKNQRVEAGNIKCLGCPSPVRLTCLTVNGAFKAEAGQDWSTFNVARCTGTRSDDEVEALEVVGLYEEHYSDESALLPIDDSQELTKFRKFLKRLRGLPHTIRIRVTNFFLHFPQLRIRNRHSYNTTLHA